MSAIALAVMGDFVDFFASSTLRPLSMVVVVLPLSVMYRVQATLLFAARALLVFPWSTAQWRHARRAARVAAEVKDAFARKQRVCTARPSWMNLSTRIVTYKATSRNVSLSDFNEILDVTPTTVTVEPGCTVGQITDWLLARGFMMATTLEIREATIGGLAMAVAMTTASHLYGLLQDTVESYEVVVADGTLLRVTRDDPATRELFHAIPWSHGSLCMLVAVTLKTVPVKRYCRVKYRYFGDQDEYCRAIAAIADDDDPATRCDFVEATVFSKSTAVVMEARFADGAPGLRVNHVGLWWHELFYKRVERVATAKADDEELVPTGQYIFRHNRGVFWTLRDQLPERVCNHPLFLFALGWMLPPQVTLLKLPAFTKRLREEMRTQRVYQDVVLPMDCLKEAVNLGFDLFGISPLLVYPSRIYDDGPGLRGTFPTRAVERNLVSSSRQQQQPAAAKAGMFFDLGIYGIPAQVRDNTGPFDGVAKARQVEEFTRQRGGAPFLYAQTFFTPDEFAATFDLTLYNRVRKAWKCEGAFVDLYEKISSDKKG